MNTGFVRVNTFVCFLKEYLFEMAPKVIILLQYEYDLLKNPAWLLDFKAALLWQLAPNCQTIYLLEY